MAKKIVPSEIKTLILQQLAESVGEPANTTYYAFAGDHMATGVTENDVTQPNESYRNLTVETFRNMIFGKKLTPSDITLMVKRYDWASDTKYDMYDDEDALLGTKKYFVVVQEVSNYHVYKCLFNNNGQASTVKPVFQDNTFDEALFAAGDDYYETSDGYQWKYMYTISSVDFNKFSSQEYIPMIANTSVQNTAVAGAINVVKVDAAGKNYNNYITDTTFTASDIHIDGNQRLFKLSGVTNSTQNFYSNTIITLTSGTGAGQFKKVISSVGNTSGVFVEIAGVDTTDANTFSISPTQDTHYEISPQVLLTDNGEQTVNAFARAIIDPLSSNSVSKVEVLNPGKNYSFSTASVLQGIADVVTPSNATVRPILSPPGGHGFDPASELDSTAICFSSLFSRDESNTLSAENTFGTFGLIRDPLYSNVEIYIEKESNSAGSDGIFRTGELVRQIQTIELNDLVTVNSSISTVAITSPSADTNDLEKFFQTGDFIYISDETVGASVENKFISTVTSVSNSSHIVVASNVNFTSTSARLHFARPVANGVVKSISSSTRLYLEKCSPGFSKEGFIIAANSFASATITGVDVNERIGGSTPAFNYVTYNQMVRCVGTGGEFTNDEEVKQTNSSNVVISTARVHSSNTTQLSLTRLSGNLATNINIVGVTSGEIFESGFYKYDGDIDPTSGNIIYLQNDVSVTRESTQSEQIRIILEF